MIIYGWLLLFVALLFLQIGVWIGRSTASKKQSEKELIFDGDDSQCNNIDCPPFADGVLDKIKLLDRSKINNDCLADNEVKNSGYDRKLFLGGTGKKYCCVKCCRDAKDIQTYMIVCPDCGDKRCAKALNHILACNKSHMVDGGASLL